MRIVLKPAGFIVLLSAIGVLIFLVTRRNETLFPPKQPSSKASPQPVASKSAVVSPITYAGRPVATDTVKNGDFAATFVPARLFGGDAGRVPQTNAKITGEIGEAWLDNSDWADLDVRYAADSNNSNSCQRIEIGAIRSGAAQFVQTLRLTPGRTYRFRVRLRASRTCSAYLGLGDPTNQKNKTVTLSPEWREYETTAQMKNSESFCLIGFQDAQTTIWVDDAVVAIVP